jgi:hypothetical protein
MGDGTVGRASGRRPAVTSALRIDAPFLARLAAGRPAPGPGIRIATVGPIARPAVELIIERFAAREETLQAGRKLSALRIEETLSAVMELSESELEQWTGYGLDLFGTPLDNPPAPDGGPTWTITWEDPAKRPATTRLLRQRARYRDSPLRAQLLHLPGGTERASIERLRDGEAEDDLRVETETDLRRARAGIRLLRGLPKAIHAGGRPGDYAGPDDPRLFEDIRKAAHEAVRQGERVNFTTLAKYGPKPRSTIRRWIKSSGYDLKAIEAEALRCTRRLGPCTYIWRRRAAFMLGRGT